MDRAPFGPGCQVGGSRWRTSLEPVRSELVREVSLAATPRLVLASSSPRRRQLLELLGVSFEVRPAVVDEQVATGESPKEFARRAALEKARAVADSGETRPILAADTVVEIDGASLGKPSSVADAARMLHRLSGREHHVHTGIALVAGGSCEGRVDTAVVRLRRLDARTVDWYVATGEPMDKAGAYAIQERGGLLVESVIGSPHTVVGLPLHLLPDLFAACGLDLWKFFEAGERARRRGEARG